MCILFQTNLSSKAGPFYLDPASNYFYNLEQMCSVFTRKKNVSKSKMHQPSFCDQGLTHFLDARYYTWISILLNWQDTNRMAQSSTASLLLQGTVELRAPGNVFNCRVMLQKTVAGGAEASLLGFSVQLSLLSRWAKGRFYPSSRYQRIGIFSVPSDLPLYCWWLLYSSLGAEAPNNCIFCFPYPLFASCICTCVPCLHWRLEYKILKTGSDFALLSFQIVLEFVL